MRPMHGGRLQEAARRFGRATEHWLDLSTGISPYAYPLPALADAVWRRLPEPCAALDEAARRAYTAEHVLAVAGTQAAIQALPCLSMLRPPGRVFVLGPTYAEHAYAWRRAGHQVQEGDLPALEQVLPELDVLVLCNPNNPNATQLDRILLRNWRTTLNLRGGWLVVDEAYADAQPHASMTAETGTPGLIVLRSFGKFFGLAGVRAGFVLAWPELLQALDCALGPWALNGPAQAVVRTALDDHVWQAEAGRRLRAASTRLETLLGRYGLASSGTPLFRWVAGQHLAQPVEHFWHRCAEQGVLLRACSGAQPGIRIGLPGTESEWLRVHQLLQRLMS